jgi:hypothetical protein
MKMPARNVEVQATDSGRLGHTLVKAATHEKNVASL